MNPTLMSRLVRRAFPVRNSLADLGDRVEGAVAVAAVVVALLAVPFAGAAGSEIYARQVSQSVREMQTRLQVDAVLVEDAPITPGFGGVAAPARARATWRLPDGLPREGEVVARHGAKAGTTVRVWVDQNGDRVDAPLTSKGAVADAVLLAVLLWTGLAASMVLLLLVVRAVHKRLRLRRLDTEWARVAHDWTGR